MVIAELSDALSKVHPWEGGYLGTSIDLPRPIFFPRNGLFFIRCLMPSARCSVISRRLV